MLEIKELLGSEFDSLVNEFMSGEIPDSMLYDMEEFDEIMHGTEPHVLACQIYFGDFNPIHDYFMFDGYGNLQSVCSFDDWVHDDVEPEKERFLEWLVEEGYITQDEIDEESVS